MTKDMKLSELADEGCIPIEFYQWVYTIERDVRVWDLTPNEIARLITALRDSTDRDAVLEERHDGREFQEGDKVHKASGYRWPGEVVAVFKTRAGKTRVVVECTVPEVAGALHIYSPEQLELEG